MPGTYWHHDDFLFEVQFQPTGEESKESHKAGDELLERFLRRLRRQNPPPQPRSQPQSAGIGKPYRPEIARTFHPNPRHYLAKHPPQTK